MTTRQKIIFLEQLLSLAKKEYSSKKESVEKEIQMDAVFLKINSL